jgi:hypothetical protein
MIIIQNIVFVSPAPCVLCRARRRAFSALAAIAASVRIDLPLLASVADRPSFALPANTAAVAIEVAIEVAFSHTPLFLPLPVQTRPVLGTPV